MPQNQDPVQDTGGFRMMECLNRGVKKVAKSRVGQAVSLTIGGVGLAASIAACEGKTPVTTLPTQETGITSTVPTTEAPTTTTTEATTTTTEAPTTTTTEATTTTTEQKTGIDKDLISKEKTLADVTGKIEKGTYITQPIGVIPPELQKLFQSKTPPLLFKRQ